MDSHTKSRMGAFSPAEIAYLRSVTMCRLATVGRTGQPHIVPMTFVYNADKDAIDLGGVDFSAGKKWRDVQRNRLVAVLVDDAQPGSAHAIEIRGRAEVHRSGGSSINPRFPTFAEEFIRVRPT